MFFATLLLARAEEAPPPLIDMDLTVAVQFGLFVLMFLVLWRLVYAPYLKMRGQRTVSIDGARAAAVDMEGRAKQVVANYDAQLAAAKQRGADERTKLRTEAATHERQALGAARDEAQRALGEARARVEAETATARRALAAQAAGLAKLVAQRIIGREVA